MTTEENSSQNPQDSASPTPAEATPTEQPVAAGATPDQAPTPSVAETLQQMTPAEETPVEADAAESSVTPIAEQPTPPEAEAIEVTPAVADTVENSAAAQEQPEEGPTSTEPAAAAENESQEKPSERIRQKLGVSGGEKPVGSVDIKTQRPEIPTNTKPVDIPGADDLDDNIAAEISAAMTGDVQMPGMSVPVPEDEASPVTEDGVPKGAVELEEVGPGSRVKGVVQQIHGDDVFLNAGLLHDVVISLKQFAEKKKQPAAGDTISAIVETIDADGLFRARLPEAKTKAGGNWDGLAVDQVVDCSVTAVNKGGLQVLVSNLKGFLPASQVDLGYVSELEKYVGQTMTVKITEVKPKKRNLVVSRRAILQEERESAQEGFWESLEVGQDMTGTVKTIKNYGAFVNLGPIDGFLHVGEISWSRINHPNEVLKEGQEIQVRVLKIDKEKTRISLGMKQLVQNPWQGLSDRYPAERVVNGKVTRTSDFGAFVELEPGVEGLVHISQLAWRRVNTVNEVLKVGDEKEFQVLEVDQKRKRVSLSLKALEKRPESARPTADDEPSRPPRKPNPNLRGGAGGTASGGGLFGNPSDFK